MEKEEALALLNQSYQKLNTTTPLRHDCGRRCGKACCSGDEETTHGVYLFPYEKRMLPENAPWFSLETDLLPGFGQVDMLVCTGNCPRELRPLGCRIFPLAPRIKEGTLKLCLDPRGRPVCPLCHDRIAALDSAFVETVKEVLGEMWNSPGFHEYITALANHAASFDFRI